MLRAVLLWEGVGASSEQLHGFPWGNPGCINKILHTTAADVQKGISSDPATYITVLAAWFCQEMGSLCACHPVHLFSLTSPLHIHPFRPNQLDTGQSQQYNCILTPSKWKQDFR